MADNILPFPATVAGVALSDVDDIVLYLLHDANVVDKAALRPGTVLVVPIKVADIAGARPIVLILP